MDQVTWPRRSLALLAIAYLFAKADVASAYHIGDAVDTGVKYGNLDALGVLRRQRPLFGKDSIADFEIRPDREDYFTMTFEDSLWGLPTVSLMTGANGAPPEESATRRQLSSWTVYFVYSKSAGNGAIHKVTYSTPEYKVVNDNEEEARFTVHYKWIEEPEVNIEAGRTTLMAIALIACVVVFVSSMSDEPSLDGPTNATNGSSRSLPKVE